MERLVSQLTHGSLFAGIGGFDLGFERAGMRTVWQVEIDEYCRRVLAKHWPNVQRLEDVRECSKRNLFPVDVISGGFPCQPHSLAGKRKGTNDERWLWPDFMRIICDIHPRFVVVENVPGLLTTAFGDVVGGLAASGYDAEWQSIPAAAFGAPHIRERVWIVAYPMANSASKQGWRIFQSGLQPNSPAGGWWEVEPNVGRVANGIPARVDRLKGLGNAIVPQIAEWIGRRIVEATRRRKCDGKVST